MKYYDAIQFYVYVFKCMRSASIHNSFIDNFKNNILFHPQELAFTQKLRDTYTADFTPVQKSHPETGTRTHQTNISEVYRATSIKYKYGWLLKQLIDSYQLEKVVELGTSVGISTSYLGASQAKTIYTLDGDAPIQSIAKNHLSKQFPHIEFIQGSFNEVLIPSLERMGSMDMYYIAGDLQYQPTLDYYEIGLKYLTKKGVVVFDDIYWSPGMTQAWQAIIKRPEVAVSIDLYKFGIVFLDQEIEQKGHYLLWY